MSNTVVPLEALGVLGTLVRLSNGSGRGGGSPCCCIGCSRFLRWALVLRNWRFASDDRSASARGAMAIATADDDEDNNDGDDDDTNNGDVSEKNDA